MSLRSCFVAYHCVLWSINSCRMFIHPSLNCLRVSDFFCLTWGCKTRPIVARVGFGYHCFENLSCLEWIFLLRILVLFLLLYLFSKNTFLQYIIDKVPMKSSLGFSSGHLDCRTSFWSVPCIYSLDISSNCFYFYSVWASLFEWDFFLKWKEGKGVN